MKIVIKNMRQRALATWLTGTSVALGVALAVAIVLIKQGVQQRFEQGTLGYEMVVGAKGSPLQLVLNTVYKPRYFTGEYFLKLFEQLRANPRVKLAVPFPSAAVRGRRKDGRQPSTDSPCVLGFPPMLTRARR